MGPFRNHQQTCQQSVPAMKPSAERGNTRWSGSEKECLMMSREEIIRQNQRITGRSEGSQVLHCWLRGGNFKISVKNFSSVVVDALRPKRYFLMCSKLSKLQSSVEFAEEWGKQVFTSGDTGQVQCDLQLGRAAWSYQEFGRATLREPGLKCSKSLSWALSGTCPVRATHCVT